MLIDFACVGNWTVADKYFLEKMVSKMRYENMNRRLLGREEGTVFANYIYFGYLLLCNKSPQLLVVQNNSIFLWLEILWIRNWDKAWWGGIIFIP